MMTRSQAKVQIKAIKSILHSNVDGPERRVQFANESRVNDGDLQDNNDKIQPIEPSQGKPESSIGDREFRLSRVMRCRSSLAEEE